MDLNVILEGILGPVGSLVLLSMLVFALVTGRYFVPKYVFDSAQKRLELLEEENTKLNDAIMDLTKQNAALERELAIIREEMERMRVQIQKLSGGGSSAWE